GLRTRQRRAARGSMVQAGANQRPAAAAIDGSKRAAAPKMTDLSRRNREEAISGRGLRCVCKGLGIGSKYDTSRARSDRNYHVRPLPAGTYRQILQSAFGIGYGIGAACFKPPPGCSKPGLWDEPARLPVAGSARV